MSDEQKAYSHGLACIEAIASIGGDPATVAELVAALRACRRVLKHRVAGEHYRDETRAFDKAGAVLAKLPENSND